MTTIKLILLSIIFVLTSGAVFSSYFRKHKIISFVAAIVGLVASYYLAQTIYDDFSNNGSIARQDFEDRLHGLEKKLDNYKQRVVTPSEHNELVQGNIPNLKISRNDKEVRHKKVKIATREVTESNKVQKKEKHAPIIAKAFTQFQVTELVDPNSSPLPQRRLDLIPVSEQVGCVFIYGNEVKIDAKISDSTRISDSVYCVQPGKISVSANSASISFSEIVPVNKNSITVVDLPRNEAYVAPLSWHYSSNSSRMRQDDLVVIDDKLGGTWYVVDFGKGYSWDSAQSIIANMNKYKYAGHSDWRLPQVSELKSLYNKKYMFKTKNGIFRTPEIKDPERYSYTKIFPELAMGPLFSGYWYRYWSGESCGETTAKSVDYRWNDSQCNKKNRIYSLLAYSDE